MWQSESSSLSQAKEDKNKNEDDNKNEDEDDAKVSFYVKVGKNKKFKYMWTSFFRLKMNYVNTNRINNLLLRYSIEIPKRIGARYWKKRFYCLQTDFIYDW